MSTQFDPYSQWLEIPEHLRPISHYEILGIQRFETNPEEIKKATARRLSKLQSLANGSQAGVARKLMSQVEAARACLLNEATRKQYEALVRSTTKAPPAALEAGRVPTPPPPPVTPPPVAKRETGLDLQMLEQLAAAESQAVTTGGQTSKVRKTSHSSELQQTIVFGAIFVLIVGVAAAIAGSAGHSAAYSIANSIWRAPADDDDVDPGRLRLSRYQCGYCKEKIIDGKEEWHHFPGYESAGDWPFHKVCYDLVQERARNSSRFAATDRDSVHFFAIFMGGAFGAVALIIYFFNR